MKITRKLLSYAGPLWLVTMSHTVCAQTAPKPPSTPPAAPAAAPKAPAAAAPKAPAAAAPKAPAAAAQPPSAPAAPAPSAAATAPTAEPAPATAVVPAAAVPAPVVLDANAPLPPPAPVAIPPAPQPVVEPAPVAAPPVATEPAKDDVLPKKIGIGNSGWLQVGALLQGWMLIQDNKRGDVTYNDPTWQFRVRRAQVKLSGDIVKDTVSFLVILDGAKTLKFAKIPDSGTATGYKPPDDTSPMLDMYITFKTLAADVSIGQWKSPISYEGTTSSAELLLPERAYTTRYFGDNYDGGVRAEKKFDYVKYSLQLLQGAPTNTLDTNRQKELALRLEFSPFNDKTLMVGGAVLTSVGQRSSGTANSGGGAKTRDIIEADVAADVAGLIARGELLWGWAGSTADGVERVKSRGMAASFGYTIAKKVQPTARISYLNVDQTTDGTAAAQPLYGKFGFGTDEIRGYELGVNYLIDGKYAKIQSAFGYFDMDNIDSMYQFILSGQASF